MIAGETRGTGGPTLARHFLSRKGNQTVEVMPARHLMGETLREQIDDLVMTSSHGGLLAPFITFTLIRRPTAPIQKQSSRRIYVTTKSNSDLRMRSAQKTAEAVYRARPAERCGHGRPAESTQSYPVGRMNESRPARTGRLFDDCRRQSHRR